MPYIIALGGLVGLVAYLIQEITRTNARPISNKIRSINEFNELDEVALDLLLENALVITTGSKRFELAQFCSQVRNEQPDILAPLQQEGELFIPALLLEGSMGYCAPGYTKDSGVQLFEMRAPYFGVDYLTPQKEYRNDYVVFIAPQSELIVFDSGAFEKIASEYTFLYRYGLKEKTKLTTAMALSYSALMAPTAFLRVARWLRFIADQNTSQGLDPIIENRSQEKIAHFLGISRTTLAGIIRVLRENGAIDTRYRKIKINIEQLNCVIDGHIKEAPEKDLFK